VRTGHFRRFSHDKVLIQKRDGQPIKVLTGSANFSVRGLYVQANNILVFDNVQIAELYEHAFEQSFHSPSEFATSAIAEGWHDVEVDGVPPLSVCFAPHKSAGVSLDRVAAAINHAGSSVMFAVMELGGGGAVLDQLRSLESRPGLFSYGMTQILAGIKVYKPGSASGLIVPFAYLKDKVPAPFQSEYRGGVGQVIHHKFVVVDFNGKTPAVFTGSSNLARGGEESNGDNLLAIYDPQVAQAYAVEAVRLVDHYHFRASMKRADPANPLILQAATAKGPWWQPYYDSKNIKCRDRVLFCP
jgi:phosphatidylserine/phosphatidylglycerophosphate/cardiolipin synthase-like enzyme